MGEIVPDPDLLDPSKWWHEGPFGVIDFSGGVLHLGPGHAQNDALVTFPVRTQPVVGMEYQYEIVVSLFNQTLPAVWFDIFCGGHTLYSAYEPLLYHAGQGTFRGRFVATSTQDMSIIFNFDGELILDRISIKEAMIDYPTLRQGIRSVILAVPGVPPDIAWENHAYKPPDSDVPWMREQLIPGTERQVASDTVMAVGIMQYDLFWPAGDGTEAPEALADAIRDAFRPHTTVDAHSTVYRAERQSGTPDEKWYRIPIRLTYRSFSVR